MFRSKTQAQVTPQVLGTMLNPSTYGQAIPVIYGRMLASLLPIWNANVHKTGGSTGFLGLFGSSAPTWVENVDFMLGHGPIVDILQVIAGGTLVPLQFNKVTASLSWAGGGSSHTIIDANFYTLIGVTMNVALSGTFHDFGDPNGSESYSGTYELPLWNACNAGPDPVNMSGYRWWPNIYLNLTGSPTVKFPQLLQVGNSGTFNFYYASIMQDPPGWPGTGGSSGGGASAPAALIGLTFEPQLGDGPEWGTSFLSNKIVYPSYAGAGADNYPIAIQTDQPTAMPNNQVEVLGTGPVYSTGDADYADMIEDIFKSGPVQSSPANTEGYNYGRIHHGLDCCDYPGAVQKVIYTKTDGVAVYPLPNVLGNTLLAWVAYQGIGVIAPTIGDTAGNTWTAIATGVVPGGGAAYGLFRATALAHAAMNQVTFANATAGAISILFEISGLDTLDTSSLNVWPASGILSVSTATTNARFTPSQLFAFTITSVASLLDETSSFSPRWKTEIGFDLTNFTAVQSYHPFRVPGTVLLTDGNAGMAGIAAVTVVVALKNSQMGNYPRTLGNILDDTTMQMSRDQARAFGLYGSLNMNSQRAASDWLKDIYTCMNSVPVFSGFKLKSIPASEASAVGNGAVYNAYTASGPIANLSDAAGDFVTNGKADTPPITVSRKARFDMLPTLSLTILDRNSNYAPSAVSEPTVATVSLFGTKKADPQNLDMITDPAIAKKILGIMQRRMNLIDRTYKFTLNTKWQMLEPMDLVTLTEPKIGLFNVPVRLLSVEEDDKFNLACEAEPFIYGVHSPTTISVDTATQSTGGILNGPGVNVNPPIIFEPVPPLYSNNTNQRQLWLVVSAKSLTYGGCVVYLSTDGGATYNPVGTIYGNATMGVAAADFAAHADPDATDSLLLDLTESYGQLNSYSVADRDNFVYPCYIEPGAGGIPYELISYATANNTGANLYTLPPTTRRSIFGAPNAGGPGVDHPTNSRFAFLTPGVAPPGILKLIMDPRWIGVTLYFKFPAFAGNSSLIQQLTGLTAYPYTPTGTTGGVNPSGASPGAFLVNGG